MTFETIERPRSAPLPEGLFKDTLQRLSPAPIERVLPSGVVLEEHGTVPEFLHILLAGSVQMYGSLSTRISTVDLIEAVREHALFEAIKVVHHQDDLARNGLNRISPLSPPGSVRG